MGSCDIVTSSKYLYYYEDALNTRLQNIKLAENKIEFNIHYPTSTLKFHGIKISSGGTFSSGNFSITVNMFINDVKYDSLSCLGSVKANDKFTVTVNSLTLDFNKIKSQGITLYDKVNNIVTYTTNSTLTALFDTL